MTIAASKTSQRAALAAFVAFEVGALPFLIWIGRSIWFANDEWDPIAARTAWNVQDLFRPHNEHWCTIPVLAYRLLFWLFGLHTHVPYLVVALVLHLTVAAMLRAVMRRAGVGPWIATISASLVVFFGPAFFNAEFAWQMALSASLALSLGQLLLVDHDGPIDRRDAFGLLLGIASLLCSGIGVTLTIIVAIAAFLRRGPRVALLHAGPLACIYAIWWAAIGRSTYVHYVGLSRAARFTARSSWHTFRALGDLPGVGAALIVVLIIGLALPWIARRAGFEQATPAVPLAMLLGAPLFLFITGVGRAGPAVLGVEPTNVARYLHVAAVLVLPALAIAADNIARCGKGWAALVVIALVIGMPGNMATFVDGVHDLAIPTKVNRTFILAVARDPFGEAHVAIDATPEGFETDVTIGWLLDSVAAGRVPPPPRMTPSERAAVTLSLVLHFADGAHPEPCRPLHERAERTLRAGDALGASSGQVDIVYVAPDGAHSSPLVLRARPIAARVGPVRVLLLPRPARAGADVVLCG